MTLHWGRAFPFHRRQRRLAHVRILAIVLSTPLLSMAKRRSAGCITNTHWRLRVFNFFGLQVSAYFEEGKASAARSALSNSSSLAGLNAPT